MTNYYTGEGKDFKLPKELETFEKLFPLKSPKTNQSVTSSSGYLLRSNPRNTYTVTLINDNSEKIHSFRRNRNKTNKTKLHHSDVAGSSSILPTPPVGDNLETSTLNLMSESPYFRMDSTDVLDDTGRPLQWSQGAAATGKAKERHNCTLTKRPASYFSSWNFLLSDANFLLSWGVETPKSNVLV